MVGHHFIPLFIILAIRNYQCIEYVFYTLQYLKKEKKKKGRGNSLFKYDHVKFLLCETGLRPHPDFCIKTTDFQNNGNYY